MSLEYSDLKAAWHLDKIAALRDTGHTLPAQVQLVISDLCNHDCPWCAYRMEGYSSNQHFAENGNHNPNRKIETSKAKEIISDIAAMGIKAIQFTGGGEPTVHPDHLEIFDHALSLGLECALVTNATILRDGWRDVLPRFSWIRVSLDAGTPETYAKIRRVKPEFFDRAVAHLSDLTEACADTGCTVGVSFICMKENATEIIDAAVIASACEAAYIRYAALFSPELGGYYSGQQAAEIEAEIARAAMATTDSPTSVVDMFASRSTDLKQGRPDYDRCGYQHFNVYIGADLKVYRCCNTAYNDLGFVGSLKDQTFRQFWGSSAKRRAYSNFSAKSCEHCAFNRQNRVISYLTSEQPKHVEFV